jgi:hypothetical protein
VQTRDNNTRWLKGLVGKGTSADKSNSLSLLVQQSPVHRLPYLQKLIAIVSKKRGRHEGKPALDSLRELFIEHLLPPYRPLKFASSFPLLPLLFFKGASMSNP